MNTAEKLYEKENLNSSFKANSSNNENLNESSVEEGNEDLKSKIPELTSKKFMRDSGTTRDQIWIVPYKQSEMVNLIIPSTLGFPLRDVDCNSEFIVVLDNGYNLWALKNIDTSDITIRRVLKAKVKTFRVWGNTVIIYKENNELVKVNLSGDSVIPKPLKQGLSISVEQIACGKNH
jgi:hypothetical protein